MVEARYHSNGKLMISGEYLVLAGSEALAMPVRYGQSLEAETEASGEPYLYWNSLELGKSWFEAEFSGRRLECIVTSDKAVSDTLQSILMAARMLNPGFLSGSYKRMVVTNTEFSRSWGLGSSSTLISNIAWWAGINPYQLLDQTLGGSGYDIACARSSMPLLYRIGGQNESPGLTPRITAVEFMPAFHRCLWFVYTGRKQSSSESLKKFKPREVSGDTVKRITEISHEMIGETQIGGFMLLMKEHEKIVGRELQMTCVQEEKFQDFPGVVKSLGAWGGDFLLAASEMEAPALYKYFYDKGLKTIIPFGNMLRDPGKKE